MDGARAGGGGALALGPSVRTDPFAVAAAPVAILILARAGEGFEPDGLEELRLTGLAADVAGTLLRAHAPGASTAVRDALGTAAAGNPLALEELPRALADDQLSGARPLPNPLPLGHALRSASSRRISTLPEATRWGLVVAAASDDGGCRRSVRLWAGHPQIRPVCRCG